MTNNSINTKTPIQALWDAYQALQACPNINEELQGTNVCDLYYALWDKTINLIADLKPETPADTKIKLEALKVILDLDGGFGQLNELDNRALKIINELLAA